MVRKMAPRKKPRILNKGKFKGRMLKLRGNWVGNAPLYRLDDNTYKQILAKRFFKKLRVEGDNIVVTLGF